MVIIPIMLETVDEVIEALGGPAEMARRLHTSPSNVGNWRLDGWIPPAWFWAVSNELWELHKEASPKVFRMRGA